MDQENPYRASDVALADMPKPNGHGRVFRSPQALGHVTVGLLIADSVLTVALIAAMAMLRQALHHVVNHDLGQAELVAALHSSGKWQAQLGSLQVLVLIATYVAAGMWIYRAGCNVRALGAKGIDDSPGWAVGWYFIPFMNFVRPFRAMNQIWLASANPARWASMSTPTLLRFWWAFWLIANIYGSVVARLPVSHSDAAALSRLQSVLICGEAANLVATIIFLVVVLRLTQSQLDQHDRMQPASRFRLEPDFPPMPY